MLRAVFTAVAGRRGSLIFIAVIVVIGIALVLRDLRQSRDRLRPGIFAGMLGESILLASVFGIVVGVTTAKLLGSLHSLSLGPSIRRRGRRGSCSHSAAMPVTRSTRKNSSSYSPAPSESMSRVDHVV